MSNAEAIAELEAQLRADPDDHETWLVYKDWLLAQGDPRGELIGREKPERTRGIAWFTGMVSEWRYGFAIGVAVRIDADGIETIALALTAPEARLVSRLRIMTNGETSLADLAALDLGRLSVLQVRYGSIGAAGVRALLGCSSLRRLHTLDIRYNGIGDDGALAIAGAPQLAGLRALALQRNDIGEAGARALATSPYLRLESLDLRYNAIGIAGAQAIAGSPTVDRLARLLLDRGDIKDVGVRALAASPHLPARTRAYWSA
jgi:uncharacterized protein (TIGR02996 family)